MDIDGPMKEIIQSFADSITDASLEYEFRNPQHLATLILQELTERAIAETKEKEESHA